MKSVSKLFSIFAVALAALTIAAAAPASAAVPASGAHFSTSVSGSHISPDLSNTPAHACTQIATSGQWQAVVCADVAEINSTTFTAQAELICNNTTTGQYEACANAGATWALWSSTEGQLLPAPGYSYAESCSGDCVTPRNYWYEDSVTIDSGCLNIWAVVYSGSYITLPGASTHSLGANLGSGHITVCA